VCLHGLGHGGQLRQRCEHPVQLARLNAPGALSVALGRDLAGLYGAQDGGAIDADGSGAGDEAVGHVRLQCEVGHGTVARTG
jgi:hypothetical protein